MSFNIHHFWNAPLAVQIHVIAALMALAVGIYVFSVRKGTRLHRNMGKAWVGLMVIIALSSFFINEIRSWGPFSAIHLISIFTLGSLAWAIYSIRRGDVQAHEYTMKGLFIGGLLVAGALTFMRDLLMHRIFFSSGTGSLIPSPQEMPGGATTFALVCVLIIFVGVFLRASSRTKSQTQ